MMALSFRKICFCTIAHLVVIVSTLAAEPLTDAPTPLAYRRILVPADQPDAWPRDGKKLLPVDASEFEAWVAAANQPAAGAQLVAAEYRARLASGQLVDGRAKWNVELHGAGSAYLSLGQPSLVVEQPRWTASDTPAQLGWWPGGAHYGLRVPKSGELEFNWHTQPVAPTGNELQIPLQLPTATRSTMILDLPAGKEPVLDGSVLVSMEPVRLGEEDWRRWTLAINATNARALRIVDTQAGPIKRPSLATVREIVRYQIAERGLDVEATLVLRPAGPPPRELSVNLPPGMQLVGATAAGCDLPWRVIDDEDGTATRAVVELPELVPREPTTLVLRVWGPLLTDEPWRLPKLEIADTFWTSGAIELAIDESLELRVASPTDCIETTAPDRDLAGQKVATRAFDAYSPSASLEITVAERPTSGRVRKGVSLQIGNPGIAGRVVALVSVEFGELHTISADVRPDWTIDAVETFPADALDQWYIDAHDGGQTMELQLNRAVTRAEGVTIIVTGRLQRSATFAPLPRETLGMLRWRDLDVTRNLLRLEAAEPYELEPIGELPTVPVAELSDNDRGLVDGPSDAPIYDLKSAAPTVAVRLAPKRGSYNAEIQLAATLVGKQLQNAYRVVCRPQQSGIHQVLAYVSEPLPEPLRWFDADSHEPIPAKKMSSSDPRLSGLPPGGELWQLNLRRLYVRPVNLAANIELPWSERRRVPLVSFPEAGMQQGRIAVFSGSVIVPTIVAQGMSPAPLPVGPPNAIANNAALAVYRFQPTRFYAAAAPPQLWLGPPAVDSVADMLLATDVAVESSYAADGTASHRVTCRLENRGAEGVTLTLPPETRLELATLDGVPIVATVARAEPHVVAIRLPSRHNAVLALHLRSDYGPLANGDEIPSPLPTTNDMTLLNGQWTIWLPEEFEAIGGAVAAADDRFDWRNRLFGPLARPRDQGKFNPFRAEDWDDLLPTGTAKSAVAAPPVATSVSAETSAPEGWHAFHAAFVAAPPEAITIAHPPATTAWALSLFLICALGGSLVAIRSAWWIPVTAIAALLCLLLPPVYAPLATGALLGLLLAPVFRWAWQRNAANLPSETVGSPMTGGSIALSLLAVVAVSSAARHATAESPPAAAATSLERVFVPVDEHQQLIGTKIFVGDEFLAQLLRRSANRSAGGSWLLLGMQCEGESMPRSTDAAESGAWTLAFDIEVSERDATIELPLLQQDAAWPAVASLDGIPAPLVWNEDGRGCAIVVREPGRYQLSIHFEPRTREVAGRQQVEFAVPPVVGTRFRMAAPTPLADVRIGDSPIPSRDEPGRTVWECELDGSGRLAASWVTPAPNAQVAEGGPIDELQWLHLGPDGVAMDVKYILSADASEPESLAILADNRWEIVANEDNRDADVEPAADGMQTFHVPVTAVGAKRREAVLRLRLRDASVLGRLQIPTLELATSRAARRWLAVSADAAFECEATSGTAIAAGADGDFAAVWGEDAAATPPTSVLDLANVEAGWYLAVRPRTVEPVADATTRDAESNEPVDSPIEATPDVAASTSSVPKPDASTAPLQPQSAGNQLATVQLAESETFLGPMGGEFAVTRFIIAPHGLDQCTVELPIDQRLARCTLDGQPALAQAVEPRRWRVQFRSPTLPQTLEVVTRQVGRTGGAGRMVVLQRPVLEQAGRPMPVALSLWSLCRPIAAVRPRASGAAESTAAEQAALRLDRLASISETATRSVVDSPVSDGYNWFVRWAAELQAAQDLARAQQLPAANATNSTRIVQPADDPLATAIARSETWLAQLEEIFADAEPIDRGHAAVERAATPPGCTWTHFVTDSQQANLDVELVPLATTPGQTRIIALVSIVAIALAAGWFARQPATADFLREWPQVGGVVLGFAAWAWLRPSWLGLAIAATSLALWLRQAYARKVHLATISTFVRRK